MISLSQDVPQDTVVALEPLVRRHFLRDLNDGEDVPVEMIERAVRGSRWRLYVGIGCMVIVPLAAIGLGLVIAHMMASRRNTKRLALLRAVTRGRLRLVWPVLFNSAFLHGELQEAPGLVLACTDDGPEPDQEIMLRLVELLCRARQSSSEAVDRQLARLMADEVFRPARRRRIPEQLTGGREICLLDLAVRRSDLLADLREHPWIPCMVGRGAHAGVLTVPKEVMLAAWRDFNGRS